MSRSEIAKSLSVLVERRPIPKSPIPLHVGEEEFELVEADYGYAEGQTFVIRYVDSGGKESVRTITVHSIDAGVGGIPLLKARCHVRKTTRAFRVDRIVECVDFDGEVHADIPKFLAENFGMHPALIAMAGEGKRIARWGSILDVVRPDALLLASVMRADGEVSSDEIGECLDHLASQLDKQKIDLDMGEVVALRRYLLRLRPNEKAILMAIDELSSRPIQSTIALLKACIQVMDADGMRQETELKLISELAQEIGGSSI